MTKSTINAAVVYYVVAFGLALAIAVFGAELGEGALALTMFTPLAAVLVVVILFVPTGSRRAFADTLGIHRFGSRGYVLAIAVPALIFGVGLAVLFASGAALFRNGEFGDVLRIVVSSLIGLVIATVLAFSEEVGWRGFLLPELLPLGTLPAMLIAGFLHGVWHLPILLLTDLYHPSGDRLLVVPMFLTTLTLAGVFYGYLRLSTNSVWPVAIAHAAVNTFWHLSTEISEMSSPVVAEYVAGESGGVMIVCLFVTAIILSRRISKP